MPRSYIQAVFLVLVLSLSTRLALAKGNDWHIKTGFGEELTVKNRSFGRKDVEIKDRLGDHYVHNQGWFGTGETDVNILGNHFQKKKRLFGGSDIQASSILGDTVVSKKGLTGRRTTTVDLSGISRLLNQFISSDGISEPLVRPETDFPSQAPPLFKPQAGFPSQTQPNPAVIRAESPDQPNYSIGPGDTYKKPDSSSSSGNWAQGVPTLGDRLGPLD